MGKLEFDSRLVGIPWKSVEKHVTWRDTTNYAACTWDMNPRYVDDEREDGIMAPPVFAVTMGWPVSRHMRELIDVPYSDEVLNRDVHYTEYIEFERPLRPGENGIDLVIQPMICATIQQRAGTNVVYKYEVRDKDGNLIHTEYNGTMLRGVTCVDGGKGSLPEVPEAAKDAGVIWEKKIHVCPEQTYLYDAGSNITFAIHTSPKFAHSVELPMILLTGTCTIAFGVREMIDRELNGEAERVKAINAKLTAMIYPDTDITIQLLERREGPEYTELFYRVLNQDGAIALNKGYVRAVRSAS